MKHLTILALGCALLAGCAKTPKIIWAESQNEDSKGYVQTLTIENAPSGTDWCIYFMGGRASAQENEYARIEHVAGSLARIVPVQGCEGALTLTFNSRSQAREGSAPADFILDRSGRRTRLQAEYSFLPKENVKSFDYTPVPVGVTDMIPALKRVNAADTTPADNKPGWYRITVKNGEASVESKDEDGAYYAQVTLENLKRNAGGAQLEDMVIEDWPDMPVRGLMLDVARNFTTKENVFRLLDLMVHYKANVFHLHFGDDEGWRVEIPGIPELTSFGAFRCIPEVMEDGTIKEVDGLSPAFTIGTGRDLDNSGNGYYSRKDFIEILKYAAERHIQVVPEFDTPGHSRAAIKSVEKYFERTGDASYMLSEPGDTSEYTSVQGFHDNVINVALPSTYNFIAKVFDELIAMYKEAGLEMKIMHIGGDEVPEGCWDGSPACNALLAENGWTSAIDLDRYYFLKLEELAAERGIKLAGWQEAAMNLRKELAYANVWNVRDENRLIETPYMYANEGIGVVLSNSPNTYADMAYNYSIAERGASWSGYIDERRGFSILPYDIYRSIRWNDRCQPVDLTNSDAGRTALENPENILGIQTQLWTETIRTFDHVTYYFFPKIVGNFERAWNASPAWQGTTTADDPAFVEDFNRFYSIVVDHEYPYYDSMGICYRKTE